MSELIPYQVTLNEKPFWVVDKPDTREAYLRDHPEMSPDALGVIAIGIFRVNSYVDYAAIGRVDDVTDDTRWIRAHEAYEWIDWMGGVVYNNPEREKQLHDTERKLGKFMLTFGWAPDVILESRPTDNEMETYIAHVVRKDEQDGQLIFPEDEDV